MKMMTIILLSLFASLLLILSSASGDEGLPGEPFNPIEFKQMRVMDTWAKYADKLTFGKGQTLVVLDDGCDLTVPEWNTKLPWGAPKVAAGWDSVDNDPDPTLVPPGYHGTGTGFPSSLNYNGRLGVAFNDQVIHLRGVKVVHLPLSPGFDSAGLDAPQPADKPAATQSDVESIARGLQWVIDNIKKYNITTVNLAPVDDHEHPARVRTIIDPKLRKLKELGVWVSAPCGNSGFTRGINWPACSPECFSIGAVKIGEDVAHLNRFKNTDLLVPASATTSSNAHTVGCAIVLREAITRSGYRWKADGKTLPDAMMAIFRKTGAKVHDPATGLDFKRIDLLAAVDRVSGQK